jgi:hypothetical protein
VAFESEGRQAPPGFRWQPKGAERPEGGSPWCVLSQLSRERKASDYELKRSVDHAEEPTVITQLACFFNLCRIRSASTPSRPEYTPVEGILCRPINRPQPFSPHARVSSTGHNLPGSFRTGSLRRQILFVGRHAGLADLERTHPLSSPDGTPSPGTFAGGP